MAGGHDAKSKVIEGIAAGRKVQPLPKDKVRIEGQIIHVRYRSNPKSGGVVWSFNINPNTLTADHELWVCGSPQRYYLIPIQMIREIYEDQGTYIDRLHPNIRVAEVNAATHECRHGSDLHKDFTAYFLAPL